MKAQSLWKRESYDPPPKQHSQPTAQVVEVYSILLLIVSAGILTPLLPDREFQATVM